MTLGIEALSPDAAPAGVPSTSPAGSVLDEIRGLYEQAQRSQHLDLALPGRIGTLVKVRYGPVEDPIDGEGKTLREVNLDFVVAACECILVRQGESFEPLTTAEGLPVGFDENLVELLDLDVPPADQGGTARDVVLAAFRAAPAPHAAVHRHVSVLSRWMVGGGGVDEEAMLGES